MQAGEQEGEGNLEQLEGPELLAENEDLTAQHDAVHHEGEGAQGDAGKYIGEHIGQAGYRRGAHTGQGDQRDAKRRAENPGQEEQIPPEQTGMRHRLASKKSFFSTKNS